MSSLTTPVDVDPLETAEWLDSLASVLDRDGPERAHFILQQMLREARDAGAYLPYSANTPYLNTIPETREAHSPGDPAIEWRFDR